MEAPLYSPAGGEVAFGGVERAAPDVYDGREEAVASGGAGEAAGGDVQAGGPVDVLAGEVEGDGESTGRVARPGKAPPEEDFGRAINCVVWGGG